MPGELFFNILETFLQFEGDLLRIRAIRAQVDRVLALSRGRLRRRHTRLPLFQNPDNLSFAEPAALHTSDSLPVQL